MTTRKNILFGLVGFLILVGALVLSGLQPVEGKGKRAVDPVLPSEIVSLVSSVPSDRCTIGGIQLVELFPDGERETLAFSVPAGHVLVVTSVQVVMSLHDSGDNVTFSLQRGTAGVVNHSVLFGAVSIGSNRSGSASVTVPNGIVVPFGSDLCFNSGGGKDTAYVYGYLAAAN